MLEKVQTDAAGGELKFAELKIVIGINWRFVSLLVICPRMDKCCQVKSLFIALPQEQHLTFRWVEKRKIIQLPRPLVLKREEDNHHPRYSSGSRPKAKSGRRKTITV